MMMVMVVVEAVHTENNQIKKKNSHCCLRVNEHCHCELLIIVLDLYAVALIWIRSRPCLIAQRANIVRYTVCLYVCVCVCWPVSPICVFVYIQAGRAGHRSEGSFVRWHGGTVSRCIRLQLTLLHSNVDFFEWTQILIYCPSNITVTNYISVLSFALSLSLCMSLCMYPYVEPLYVHFSDITTITTTRTCRRAF